MSAVVVAMMAAHIARSGIAPQADEGAAAHIFQLLMPAQIPIIAFFALTWLPRDRMHALEILALQIGAAIVPFAIVFTLHW
jgi:mannose/fructose/N-acetylgalactosamine-specific phosphotransferase system component IID